MPHEQDERKDSAMTHDQDERDTSGTNQLRGEHSTSSDPLLPPGDEYGFGRWTPEWGRRINTPGWALAFFCLMVCVQGMMMNGYVQTAVTTIEKRFHLKSSTSGMVISVNDVAIALSLLPVSHYGGRRNKCTWIATGAAVFSLGCLVFALPHFLIGEYTVQGNSGGGGGLANDSQHLCDSSVDEGDLVERHCAARDDLLALQGNADWLYLFLFLHGRLLQGVGCTSLFILAIVYIDENVMPATSSFYMGIFYGMSLVGPTIGYLMGASLLRLWINVERSSPPAGVGADHPLWLGAWWIGFLVGAILSLLFALPILGYPSRLPGYEEVQKKKVSEVHQDEESDESEKSTERDLDQLPDATWSLIKNPVYTLVTLNNCWEALMTVGLAAFFPKFVEAQFNLPPSAAAVTAAAIGIPAAGIGTIMGGWLIQRFDMTSSHILHFCKWATLIGCLFILGFLTPCENVPYVGISTPYTSDNSVSSSPFESSCNLNCSCVNEDFYPICGADNRQYFSPCHAGCKSSGDMSPAIYEECSCIPDESSSAVAGTCSYQCDNQVYLVIALFTATFASCITFVPTKAVLLRIVPEEQRSLALGLRWIFSCVLGSIPGPIVVGALMDSTCLHWKVECGEQQDTCILYDTTRMRHLAFLLAISMKVLALLCLLLAIARYKPPKLDTERIPIVQR